ncbi:MAG: hypothetical protein IPN69_08535 [Acidobacteria bacterium]|nr:hypothetical protein [Acidobacteriota bacterium]
MAKWTSQSVMDGGSDLIRTLAGTAGRVKMHAIKAYSASDSYSTVVTTNSCGSVDLAAGDIVQSGAAGAARVSTFAAKSIALTANSGASPDTHIAVVDSVGSAVLLVTDETNNQQMFSGNTLAVPAWTWTLNQPT